MKRGECGVESVECEVGNLKCVGSKLWSVKCGV